jgi:hypothetical protein
MTTPDGTTTCTHERNEAYGARQRRRRHCHSTPTSGALAPYTWASKALPEEKAWAALWVWVNTSGRCAMRCCTTGIVSEGEAKGWERDRARGGGRGVNHCGQ